MSDEWVMVPRKLAESQRNAMAMTHRHDYGIREEWERENIRKHMDQLHRAMLDAAPKPPVPETNFGNMLDCDIEPRPLDFPLRDYHHAIGEGPLHYTWTDKPHRLVYDLIAAVRYYAAPKPQEQAEPVAWFDPTNKDPRQAVTFRKADQDEWPHIYSAPLYSHPDPQVQRLRDALKPFAAIDLTTNQAVDPMDVLRARRALEGK